MADLLKQATDERALVEQTKEALSKNDGRVKANALVEVQEKAGAGGAMLEDLNRELGQAIAAQVDKLSNEDKIAFIRDDIGRLEKMSEDTRLPQVTRDVLKEVLANVEKIKLTETGRAAAGFTRGPGPKYFVSQTVLPGTAPHLLTGGARLGGVAHELTHVSVSESYDNTEMMLAYTRDLPPEEIKNLGKERVAQLDELIELSKGILNLQPDQKKLLNGQLTYAKMQWYNEFDTVINQCLVYMASWSVPENDKFYEHLRQVATEAYQKREAARTPPAEAQAE